MSSSQFKDQVAVVTGAGQGIGFEIARQLAAKGAAVIVNDIDEKLANDAVDKIDSEGGVAHAVAGNAAEQPVIQHMVEEAVSRFGKLTITIANAGITLFGEFFEYERSDLQQVMDLNLTGTFFLAQAAARRYRKQGSGGSILLMSSVTAHTSHKELTAYGMTKAGIEGLARVLVTELSPYNITVNSVAPGATLTERTIEDEEYEEKWAEVTPTGRAASVQDIAQAALFLVSPDARHITGQNLVVDGGWSSVGKNPYS